ncbi:hypothetical protein LCGC14_2411220 [marine sediment metagenome]|uniref:Uncharacterized protein n=1 Tax=marine sediment metagenome TaxID=412755 RepID=A0A0F9ELX3_9ZZZZ
MNRLALTIAATGLFVLAIVAWLGGCTIYACAVRALVGGVAIYLGSRVALNLLAGIIADTIVRARMSQDEDRTRPNE